MQRVKGILLLKLLIFNQILFLSTYKVPATACNETQICDEWFVISLRWKENETEFLALMPKSRLGMHPQICLVCYSKMQSTRVLYNM